METTLYCKSCGKVTAVIRDGKFCNGIATYCKACTAKPAPKYDVPDFMQGLFGKKK